MCGPIIQKTNKICCEYCDYNIEFDNRAKTLAQQHCGTTKHKHNAELNTRPKLQFHVGASSSSDAPNKFFADFTHFMVKSNIPLSKVENPYFKEFLETHFKKSSLSRSVMQKEYLKREVATQIEKIKQQVVCKEIYIVVDECTDALGR